MWHRIGAFRTMLTQFNPVYRSYRNQSSVLQNKTNNWFLYETQHWTEMGEASMMMFYY